MPRALVNRVRTIAETPVPGCNWTGGLVREGDSERDRARDHVGREVRFKGYCNRGDPDIPGLLGSGTSQRIGDGQVDCVIASRCIDVDGVHAALL